MVIARRCGTGMNGDLAVPVMEIDLVDEMGAQAVIGAVQNAGPAGLADPEVALARDVAALR